MSDLDERDQVSSWCWDGMCQHCDNDWCDHHCHAASEERSQWANAARVVGLSVISALASMWLNSKVPADWPGLAAWSVKALLWLACWALAIWIAQAIPVRGDR